MRSRTAVLLRRCKTLLNEGISPHGLLALNKSNPACLALIATFKTVGAPPPQFSRASELRSCTPTWHYPTRLYSSSFPGADLAQRILSADGDEALADIAPFFETLDPAGLPAVARAAAVSGAQNPEFKDALVAAAVRGLPNLAAADLCSVVESLAELGAYSVTFKDATADQVMARLDEFSGDMLGHTLRAFGSMHYYDDELLEAVVSHMSAQPDKFSAENVADVVYALSQSNFCHPDLVTIVEHAGELLLEEAAHDKGEAIASIMDAYSRVGCSDSVIIDGLLSKVAVNPQGLSGEAMCKLVTAAVSLGCEDEQLLAQLLDAVMDKVDDISPKGIVKMVSALGELGLCHQKLLDTLTDRAIPDRLTEYHTQGLANLVNSLNKLGYYNQDFMAMLQKQRFSPDSTVAP